MSKIELSQAAYQPYEDKMAATLRVLDDEFHAIRAGRANPRLLDKITVDYYGVETPLNQVANIQVPEARLLSITPWEVKMLKEIERAIQASDLGINPNNDGKCIRLGFPQLTEERRRDLAKEVSALGEQSKVAIRNVRREAIDCFRAYEKDKRISEDDLYLFEGEIQKVTDKFIAKVDDAVKVKENELMEI